MKKRTEPTHDSTRTTREIGLGYIHNSTPEKLGEQLAEMIEPTLGYMREGQKELFYKPRTWAFVKSETHLLWKWIKNKTAKERVLVKVRGLLPEGLSSKEWNRCVCKVYRGVNTFALLEIEQGNWGKQGELFERTAHI